LVGKRAHGRLVHEVREALFRAGFLPTRVTQLDTPRGLRPTRSPGFKVEKHNDGKSVRLFHVAAGAPAGPTDSHPGPSPERSQTKRLADYKSELEQAGFASLNPDGRERPAPYTLWRRAAAARPTGAPCPLNDGRG
jgi:hypothetical protein